MADINLDDLLKAKEREFNTQTAQIQPVEPQTEIAKVTQQTEMISPEDRRRIDEIKNAIDLTNSQASVQYGVNAQRNIAEFSDTILNNIRSKDSGYVGDLLSNLVVKVKGFEVDSNDKGSFIKKIPIIGSIVSSAKNMMAEYDKLSVQVDKIQAELDKARMLMLKDIVMFDTMYDKNVEYFKELQLYIKAGEEKIVELQTQTIPKLRMQAANSQNQMAVQLVSDFENAVSRFEKKVHDLKLSKTIAIQTAPQIRLIQNNDKVLVDKVQSAIFNTIPLWKSQIVIALGLSRQQKVLQMQREITNTTNELLRRNAEMLKQSTLETARETERGIVDIETVKKVNDDLISTIEETIKIQQEGRQKRKAAEAQLVQIEDRLKQTLLAHR
ncbi:MAG TPA: toxic anion resistance protein [Megamonas hypermegale]|uniref:Toxic anion resistance protein n=2 Tax=Megamonas hypermegale TaxID=158847 RepID=A0A921HME6_9FIRM|nr:toxic anion resistance protein [Megamonas hypermegale]MDM8144092.1 toxic anion resistance protein [Megamonas hypermegale]HJF85132.1 toxic anion resistance protein [Megamonas hypermegale]